MIAPVPMHKWQVRALTSTPPNHEQAARKSRNSKTRAQIKHTHFINILPNYVQGGWQPEAGSLWQPDPGLHAGATGYKDR